MCYHLTSCLWQFLPVDLFPDHRRYDEQFGRPGPSATALLRAMDLGPYQFLMIKRDARTSEEQEG